MNKRIYRKIGQIVGKENIKTALEDRICYSYDGYSKDNLPDAIIHPSSVEQVVALVGLAYEYEVPVIPRGAGTGLSGGALAPEGGMILHLDRMNQIKLAPEDMIAVTGPGVINWDLKEAAAKEGLFYPPDPSSTKICTIGGNVAENAGGPYGAKYGVTGDYVTGLEAVLPTGQVMRSGGRPRRDVTGYDITSLLVGSEGTLAVVTEITVRLLPRPVCRRTVIIGFESLKKAGSAINAIYSQGVLPAALEIMDATTLACVQKYKSGQLPQGKAAVLIEIDGEEDGVQAQMDRSIIACEEEGGAVARQAEDDESAEKIWETRRLIAPALGRMSPGKIGEDVSVPVGSVVEMIEKISSISGRHNIPIAVFGHAGDGNLHPNILTDKRDPEKMLRTERAVADLFEAALALGGTISGEHGIGTAKSKYIARARDPEVLKLMKEIKRLFDPKGIMNPGKIF